MNQDRNVYNLSGMIFILSLVFISVAGLTACQKEEVKKAPRPPAKVNVVTVLPKTIPVEASFVARVESAHQVEIVARVNGFLERILYEEGEVVKQGQKLFLMDQKPFIAQVDAAKGALENVKAQLWTAQANVNRVKPLAELDAASKSDLDNAIGAVESAKAAVSEAAATLEEAELKLSYTVIKSPVLGVSGEAKVREGAYLSVGPGGDLSYVSQLDPIWVTFSVSQNQRAKMKQDVEAGRIMLPPNREFIVEIQLSDGNPYPQLGKVSFIDPTFNSDTGTFLIKAELSNPESLLRPGMFVTAILEGTTRPNALVVPQRAVQLTQNGHVVFVVSDGKAERRPVIVGAWVEQDWEITKGLNKGDQVITDGFMRLAPGMPVKIVTTPVTEKEETKASPPPTK